MLVEELPFGVAVYANIRVQAYHIPAPQLSPLVSIEAQVAFRRGTQDETPQSGPAPERLGEPRIVNLKAIIYSYGIALFGLPRCRSERERREE